MRGRGWAGGSLLLQLALIPILFAVALALFGDRDVESSAGTPSPEPVDQVGGEPFGHAIQVRSSHGPVTAPRYSRQQEAGAPD
jgi:hypothetical protein